MNLGTIWVRFMEKTRGRKSRTIVPLKETQWMVLFFPHVVSRTRKDGRPYPKLGHHDAISISIQPCPGLWQDRLGMKGEIMEELVQTHVWHPCLLGAWRWQEQGGWQPRVTIVTSGRPRVCWCYSTVDGLLMPPVLESAYIIRLESDK